MDQKRWQELLRAIKNEVDIDAAVEACFALRDEAEPEDLPRLYELIQSDDGFIRECAAAEPLAKLAGADALPALLNALTRGRNQGMDNDGLCSIIMELLHAFPQESSQLLQKDITSTNNDLRQNAAWAWGSLAEHLSPKPLINALADPEPDVRTAAAGSLSSFDQDPAVIKALLPLLQDEDEQVRISTVVSLGYLGDKTAIPALQDALSGASAHIRPFILEALKKNT